MGDYRYTVQTENVFWVLCHKGNMAAGGGDSQVTKRKRNNTEHKQY